MHWIESLFTVPDERGVERLVARMANMPDSAMPRTITSWSSTMKRRSSSRSSGGTSTTPTGPLIPFSPAWMAPGFTISTLISACRPT